MGRISPSISEQLMVDMTAAGDCASLRQPVAATDGASRMFAMAVPGLGALVADEVSNAPDLRVASRGFDGRADVVLFEAEPRKRSQARSLRTTEDVFVEVAEPFGPRRTTPAGLPNGCGDPNA